MMVEAGAMVDWGDGRSRDDGRFLKNFPLFIPGHFGIGGIGLLLKKQNKHDGYISGVRNYWFNI